MCSCSRSIRGLNAEHTRKYEMTLMTDLLFYPEDVFFLITNRSSSHLICGQVQAQHRNTADHHRDTEGLNLLLKLWPLMVSADQPGSVQVPAVGCSACFSCCDKENFMSNCILLWARKMQLTPDPLCALLSQALPVSWLIVLWAGRRKLHHCPASYCSRRTGHSVHQDFLSAALNSPRVKHKMF